MKTTWSCEIKIVDKFSPKILSFKDFIEKFLLDIERSLGMDEYYNVIGLA